MTSFLKENTRTMQAKAKVTKSASPSVASSPIAPPSVAPPPVADVLVRTMDELSVLMAKELAFLEKQDMKGLGDLLPLKHKLISTYIANIKSLEAHPESFRGATEDIKNRIKASGQKLEKATAQNAVSFMGAVKATRRIVNNVMGLIREETAPKHAAYGNPRSIGFASRAYSGAHPSVAVNRTA